MRNPFSGSKLPDESLNYRFPATGERFLALLLDYTLVTFLIMIPVYALSKNFGIMRYSQPVGYLIFIIYRVISETLFCTTIGKWRSKMIVVTSEFQWPGFWNILKRHLPYIIMVGTVLLIRALAEWKQHTGTGFGETTLSVLKYVDFIILKGFLYLAVIADFISISHDPASMNRMYHDRISGTVVIKKVSSPEGMKND